MAEAASRYRHRDTGAATMANRSVPPTFKVLYDFDAEEEGELDVKANTIVEGGFSDDEHGDGWMLVEWQGTSGYVPEAYLEKQLHAEDHDNIPIPSEYICPITQDIMVDPVVCVDGQTYERAAIEEWFENHQTSPNTNKVLESKMLIPNHALRSVIQGFACKHKARPIADTGHKSCGAMSDWSEYKTAEGKPYFHNKATGATSWTKPAPSPTAAPGGGGGGGSSSAATNNCVDNTPGGSFAFGREQQERLRQQGQSAENKAAAAAEPPRETGDTVSARAGRWTIKTQVNGCFRNQWPFAHRQGVSFDGLESDRFEWRLHRRGCATSAEMEQPSVVVAAFGGGGGSRGETLSATVADGIRSHMQRFKIGMWALYDSRGRAVMNGCGDSGTDPIIVSSSFTLQSQAAEQQHDDLAFQHLISVRRADRPRPRNWQFATAGLTWPLRISWPAQTLHDTVRLRQGKSPLEVPANTLYFKPEDQSRSMHEVLRSAGENLLWSTSPDGPFSVGSGARSDHHGGGAGDFPSWASASTNHGHTLAGCISGYWTLQYTIAARRGAFSARGS